MKLVQGYQFRMSYLATVFAITLYQCEILLYGTESGIVTLLAVRL